MTETLIFFQIWVESVDHGDGRCVYFGHGGQVIGMLKEQEAGAKTADVCHKHGISSATFYKFKAKFGGMEVSDARRLKRLRTRTPG
jgi:putative transposase